jgi:capsular polysaccharide biosynthesis protein
MSRTGPAVPLIGAAVGLLLGLGVTLLQESTYRADASIVLVREGQPPGSDPELAEAAKAAAELFDSRAVTASAIRNLGLDDTPQELLDRLDVDTGENSSLVRIAVEAPSKEEARRAAQEAAEVAAVLFNDRFAPQTTASVWEPAAAAEERVSPKPARNLALGLLLGTLAGLAIVLVGLFRDERSRRPADAPKAAPAPAPQVTAPVADTERGPWRLPRSGEWTVADVEQLLAQQGDAFPERREELEAYVDSFRSVAAPDGRLSGDLEQVIEDVFGPLIERAR